MQDIYDMAIQTRLEEKKRVTLVEISNKDGSTNIFIIILTITSIDNTNESLIQITKPTLLH